MKGLCCNYETQEKTRHRNRLQGERRLSGQDMLQELHGESHVLAAGDLPLQPMGAGKPSA